MITASTQVLNVIEDATLSSKFERLRSALREYLDGGLLIAFSGGVDSAFLVWAAEQERKMSGGTLLALTTSSESLATAEREDVEKFVRMYDLPHIWCKSREFDDPAYLVNDVSRCYHCKSELFRICGGIAAEHGLGTVSYGYNASDIGDVRPGHRAAIENGVVSPLADAGISKDDIRELMRINGIPLAEKPASPCLSSRIVTGVSITSEKVRAVNELETLLRKRGLSVFRVRMHEMRGAKFARLEVASEEMEIAFSLRDEFTTAAKDLGFRWVTLDLAGYRTGGGNAA